MSQNTFIGNYTSIKDSEKKNFDLRSQIPNTHYEPASSHVKHGSVHTNKENENTLNQNLLVEPKILFQNTLTPSELGQKAVHNSRGISKDSKSRQKNFIYGEDADDEARQGYQIVAKQAEEGSTLKIGCFAQEPSPIKQSRNLNFHTDNYRNKQSQSQNSESKTTKNIQIYSPKCSEPISMIESIQSQTLDGQNRNFGFEGMNTEMQKMGFEHSKELSNPRDFQAKNQYHGRFNLPENQAKLGIQ